MGWIPSGLHVLLALERNAVSVIAPQRRAVIDLIR